MLSPDQVRRILTPKGEDLSDEELVRRLALLSAIAAEIEKAYKATRASGRT